MKRNISQSKLNHTDTDVEFIDKDTKSYFNCIPHIQKVKKRHGKFKKNTQIELLEM